MDKRLILVLIVAASLFLRLYGIRDGIIFGYDQARDAYRVRSFVHDRNIMLLGPETDIPGVHHGVGYYYLLALPYAVSASPVAAAVFFAVLCGLFAVFLYRSAKDLFGSETVALSIAALYAVSFEMVQYARWLSNPVLGALSVYCLWYYLVRYIRGDRNALLISFLFAGLSVHFQLFLLYASALVFVLPFVYRKSFHWPTYLKGVGMYALFLVPFLVAEIRFGGQLTKSFGVFLSNAGAYHSPLETIAKISFRVQSVLEHLLVPGYPLAAAGIFLMAAGYIILLASSRKTDPVTKQALTLLIIWHVLTYSVYIFSSGAVGTEFSFVGGVVSVIVMVGFAIGKMLEKRSYTVPAAALLLFLVLYNGNSALTQAKSGSYLFSVQLSFTYGLEKELVDYVYAGTTAADKFSICTLTNPFYVNTTWAYLFSTYGKGKYGFVPFWAGTDQSRALGGGDLPEDKSKPELRYLIYEPPAGMPDYMPPYFRNIENYISTVVETKKFGDMTVEKRKLKSQNELAGNVHNGDYQWLLENGKLFSCYH